MKMKLTESVESAKKIGLGFTGFDYIFLISYAAVATAFGFFVHSKLIFIYIIFHIYFAFFLRAKTHRLANRRNIEHIYFMLTKDIICYKPYIKGEDYYEDKHEKERE